MAETLIVVPMRAGSEGLPGKHLRRLGGIPVAQRVLEMLHQIDADIVVSTNDPAVHGLVDRLGMHCLVRRPELCGPAVTLDPVVADAVEQMRYQHAIVASVQATSPFLRRETVDAAIGAVRDEDYDSATVVVDDRHLRWEHDRPPQRVNRQQMAPAWRETAAILVTRLRYVLPTGRLGPRVKLIPISGPEAVDLDTEEDWAIAEWYAGTPTNRECLMARVLGERTEPRGLVCVLSSWDEHAQDDALRTAHIASIAGPQVLKIHGADTAAEARIALASVGRHAAEREHVTIVTSAYHQVRTFLTFLRVLQQRELDQVVRLWNWPAPSRMAPLEREWTKIREYQAKGDVATYEAGLEYLDWRDRA